MTTRKPQFLDTGRVFGETVFEQIGRVAARFQETTPLRADLLESHDEFLVIFDAPGATASDVQVRYDEGAIEVRIDRFRSFREDYEMRFPGRGLSLDGRADLPDDAEVDPEGITAELRSDGTLFVTVPKVDEDVELDDIDA